MTRRPGSSNFAVSRLTFTGLLVLAILACSDQSAPAKPSPPPPVPKSNYISAITFDWSGHKRLAPGSDNWPVTWGAQDIQYTTWGDGGGFGGTNARGRVSLGVASLQGAYPQFSPRNLWGGHNSDVAANVDGKSYALLMVDGTLYMWVSPKSGSDNYKYTRLHYSADKGRSWHMANWRFDAADDLALPAFLQFGANYSAARDDYVYIYFVSPQRDDELGIQVPGRIYLARVKRAELLQRSAYEFFSGIGDSNRPEWATELDRKQAVFQDSAGVGWTLSVSYNAGIERYLLATEHGESFKSRLGLFEAQEPWGPWYTVYYGTFGENEVPRSVFYYNFSNSWSSRRDFVLLFSGIKKNDSWNAVPGSFTLRRREKAAD